MVSTQYNELKNRLSSTKVNIMFLPGTSQDELIEIISILDQLIELINKQKTLTTLIEFRQYYLSRANAKQFLKKYLEAEQDYEKVKSLVMSYEADNEWHYLKALEGIAWNKARRGNYSEALFDSNELIAHAYKIDALLGKFFLIRGACYKELGQMTLALRSFRLAETNPFLLQNILSTEGDEAL
ncbi:MAG: hypothetical protein PHT77_01415 [Bacteroidales bacterium]|nr:hypothetical protein [Bacteroidales bacterium]